MNKSLITLLMIMLPGLASAADFKGLDNKALTIGSIEVTEIPDTGAPMLSAQDMVSDCNSQPQFNDGENLPISILVDEIINTGKKIWTIIEAGKPVVNIKLDVGTALPKGAKCWLDLQNWSKPESHTYEAVFKNLYGYNVVKFNYHVLTISGGTVDGVGKYVAYATVQPYEVEVSWGFSLNAQVSIPSVFNMGTKQAPVAGMQLMVDYKVDSVVKHLQFTDSYFTNGEGAFERIK